MLGASLRHRGVQLLRRIDDLERAAADGSTAGIPLLHPWANRLDGMRYHAAGREVDLDPASPLLHRDANGLPIHGVPWSRLRWDVVAGDSSGISARLEWDRPDLLAVFPFPHRLEMTAVLDPAGLTITTTLVATASTPVPISFGFHPYLGLPSPRAEWILERPAMRRLGLDPRGLPTGDETPSPAETAPLSGRAFDDAFARTAGSARFSVADAGRRLSVEPLEGFRFAQIYAPAGSDFIAFEPMTAPANALVRGRGLEVVAAGGRFRTAFRIAVSFPDSRP